MQHAFSVIYSSYQCSGKLRNYIRLIIRSCYWRFHKQTFKFFSLIMTLQHIFFNLPFCSEHFISIKHRISATFNINKKNQFCSLYIFNTVCLAEKQHMTTIYCTQGEHYNTEAVSKMYMVYLKPSLNLVVRNARINFFQLFNWFQLFSSDKNIPKVAGHCLEEIK